MANEITYQDIMKLKEAQFTAFIQQAGEPSYIEWVKKASQRTEERKNYPRVKVWDAEKNDFVMRADKSRQPRVTQSPISFMSLKKAFCEECLGIQKKAPVKKETFRDRFANL
jgi:hypothetical protein